MARVAWPGEGKHGSGPVQSNRQTRDSSVRRLTRKMEEEKKTINNSPSKLEGVYIYKSKVIFIGEHVIR